MDKRKIKDFPELPLGQVLLAARGYMKWLVNGEGGGKNNQLKVLKQFFTRVLLCLIMLSLERLGRYFASTSKRNIIGQGDKEEKEVRMQGSKLYVGNLSFSVTSEQLKELFSNYGEVKQVNIIEGRGFGFVEMSSSSEAEKAKEALDGSDFKGRSLKVNEARPPKSRQRRGYRGDYRRY